MIQKNKKFESSSSLTSEDLSDHSSVETSSNNEESPVPEIKIKNPSASKYSKCRFLRF